MMGFFRENFAVIVAGGIFIAMFALFNVCVARSFDVYADLLRSLRHD